MSLRFAYFYLMEDDPDRVRATVPRHVAHWHGLGLTGYLGGPFADRTGGLIIFQADDDQQAQLAVDTDPFVQDGLLRPTGSSSGLRSDADTDVHPSGDRSADRVPRRTRAAGLAGDGGTVTKGRLEAFSDGVFAIAITLLVIELRPPQPRPGERLAQALWQQWPSYVAYLVSFVTIGVIWLNHHWILEQVVQVDGPLLVLNLNMLLWAALLPFPTAVLAEHLAAGGETARTAAALYSGVLVLLALAGVALFAWVIHDDRLHRLPPVVVRATRVQFLVGLAMYGVAFVLSWVSPLLALAVCGALALNHGRHHLRRRPVDIG